MMERTIIRLAADMAAGTPGANFPACSNNVYTHNNVHSVTGTNFLTSELSA